MGSLLIYFAVLLFIAYLGWGVTLYILQPKLLYFPVRQMPYTPAEVGLEFENVIFKSADGLRLSGWYVPAPLEAGTKTASAPLDTRRGKSLTGSVQAGDSSLTGPAQNSQLTILFCHGNGGNMTHCLDSIDIFHDLGLNCFIFDYRGYGHSQGKPCEEGTYLDAEAAYKWLTEEKKISPDNIIAFGRSLGGSIAAHLATKSRVGAVVIESTFTSYVDVGRKFYPYMPVRWFARFSYNTAQYIKEFLCPVMLIYSRDDEVVPFEFGLELYEAANEPKKFVEIFGGHNDGFLVSGEIYKNAWKSLKEYKRRPLSHRAF
jgi:fermentation-respiration switch protein FrsA (DUF1100 family)